MPFEPYLWFSLLSIIILATILILIHEGFFIDNLFMGLELLCNQCGNDGVQNAYIRIVSISLRIMVLFLAALYGAIITSYFSVEIFKPPFTSLQEFLKNRKYQVATRHGFHVNSLAVSRMYLKCKHVTNMIYF